MSNDRLSSTGIVVLKSEQVETNRVSGNGTTRIYTGSRTLMIQQRMVELGYGASMTKIESTGDGNYQLTAGYTWDAITGSQSELPVNSHNLENSMNQVDVWNNPVLRAKFLSVFGSLAASNDGIGYVKWLKNKFESEGLSVSGGVPDDQIDLDYPPGTYPTQNALIKNAFHGVAYRGITNSLQFDTVYRRRITAASYNQIQASFTGKGQIWTTAEVVSFENVPSAWWFQLPSTYLWLKTAPEVNTVANQKTEISYSYMAVAEAWGLLYTAYGSATLLSF